MAQYTIDKIEYNGNDYILQDSGALQLTGGNVTGPVSFGNSVSIDTLTAGSLVVNGNGSFTNNLQVNAINGINVGSNPKFTDSKVAISVDNSSNSIFYPILGLKDVTAAAERQYTSYLKYNPSLKTLAIDGELRATKGVFNELVATTLSTQSATIENLTATNAKVMGLLDVQGELHTNKWTNANIANVGGSFYIAPTVSSNNQMTVTFTKITTSTPNYYTMSVSGGNFATDAVKIYDRTHTPSTYNPGWPIGSHVMITGNVRAGDTGVDYPLGTLTGYLNSSLTESGFIVTDIVADNHKQLEQIIALGPDLQSYNISISMFEIGPKNAIKPVGIMMTSYGVDKSTYLDIYGGVNQTTSGKTNPNLRIGYLGGLPNFTIGGKATVSPTGWGIYTDNGFFQGTIAASNGIIGGFDIGDRDLYNGDLGATNSVWMSLGTSGQAAIGGSESIANWAFTASDKFGVTKSGDLWANSAHIDGAIVARSLTISDSGSTYSGIAAINANGYTIEIINDDTAMPGYNPSATPPIIPPEGSTYIYPVLYLNGQSVPSTDITYTHFVWFKDNSSIGTAGDSTKGGIVAPYGHSYRATYTFTDDEVGQVPTVQEVHIDPSKYITQITDRGITIHPEVWQGESSYIQLDGSGLELCDKNNNSLAKYGATARIGNENSSHFMINADSLQAFDNSSTPVKYFEVTNNSLQFGNTSKFIMTSNSLEAYSGSTKYFEVSANGLTWGNNNTAATTVQVDAAAQTASNYIKIDGTGIRVQNSNDATDYIYIDSNKIALYRNNIEKMYLTDSLLRLGDTLNYINLDASGMKIFKNSVQTAYFGNNGIDIGINSYFNKISFCNKLVEFAAQNYTCTTPPGYSDDNRGLRAKISVKQAEDMDYNELSIQNGLSFSDTFPIINGDGATETTGASAFINCSAGSHSSHYHLKNTFYSNPSDTSGYRDDYTEIYSKLGGDSLLELIAHCEDTNNTRITADSNIQITANPYASGEGASISLNTGVIWLLPTISLKSTKSMEIVSDKQLKIHQHYLEQDAIEFIRKLQSAYYIKDKKYEVGFYAQDVALIDPWKCLTGDFNEYKTLNYTEILPPLVTYCQYLEACIEKLEKEVYNGDTYSKSNN